ncbi:MAG: UDP-glucose 4-epimerase GalE [Spirochaetia bacterium]|nr:UDP-glucose 4-epimerase GalE [Spirochaetia bacterium]MBP5739896.1 UDP-glucose 4-epimerase GalE [Spirochaetia bacterium]
MKALIIGGAGYIGSHVARHFLDNGHKVTVFDNLSTGQMVNIFQDEDFIKGDILNPAELDSAMAGGYDLIIHLAAFKAAGESMEKPEKYSVNNITGTINILNSAVKAGIENIVFSSSAAVYGEPAYLPIDEEHPKNPANYYGFTKLAIEDFLGWYDRLKGLKFAALRYFNAAGYDAAGRIKGLEKNPANLLPIIMEAAAGIRKKLSIFGNDYPTPDGTCIRDYIHVTDLATGHLMAAEYLLKNRQSLTVNLGTGNGISVQEMSDKAKAITGVDFTVEYAPRRPGDPANLVASSDKAYKLLGWKAEHSSVEDLISSSWNMYK